VDADAARGAGDLVLLDLRDVVADVVDQARALGGLGAEDLPERAARVVGHELAISEGEVGRRVHRAPVVPRFR